MATDQVTSKRITLHADWRHFFIPYLLSVLAIPLFGIGFIALYFVRKRHTEKRFEVTDTRITAVDSDMRRSVDLADIDEVAIRSNWLQETFGIGTLVLKTSATGLELPGMRDPAQLKATIEKAATVQKEQNKIQSFRERPDPDYKPGSMEKMDYLTGLWQQGLLSDDDYENEKRNLE